MHLAVTEPYFSARRFVVLSPVALFVFGPYAREIVAPGIIVDDSTEAFNLR